MTTAINNADIREHGNLIRQLQERRVVDELKAIRDAVTR